MSPRPPRILCLSGHDPGGGAGIHADIEAVAAQGGHALSVITVLTVQDSRNVRAVRALDPDWIAEQISVLLADGPVAAVKIGLLGDAGQVERIAQVLEPLTVPVVLDPVLRAGGGRDLADADLIAALRDRLLPQVSLATPNAAELRRLVPRAASLDAAAGCLLADTGCELLVTGGDEPGAVVTNRAYRRDGGVRTWQWPRLPHTFHGAGCTLAAAIAARLGRGEAWDAALDIAQRWTWQALARAVQVGQGRPVPHRRAPADDDDPFPDEPFSGAAPADTSSPTP